MNEQNAFEQEVQALRLAADRGDWNSCRDTTEVLLLRLPTNRAVRLTRDFVTRRLRIFERQQARVHWPRELLEVLTEEAPASSARRWPWEDEFPGPGGNSFANAVESLWSASLHREDVRQCITELVDALSGAIMAERVEYWGSRHPDEWALWYRLASRGAGDPRTTDILLAIKRDPDVQRLVREAWLEVAERLEAALREG